MGKEEGFWNKKTWIGLLIVIIMVSSSAGIMLSRDNDNNVKYNGYTFTRANSGWILNTDGKEMIFNFHPLDVEEIPIEDKVIDRLDVVQAYLTFEVGKKLQYIDMIRFEFITAMQDNFETYIESGVLNKTDAYDFPIIDCINATKDIPVIKFVFANETKVYVDGNCIIAEAQSELDFLAITEKILYKLLGVM